MKKTKKGRQILAKIILSTLILMQFSSTRAATFLSPLDLVGPGAVTVDDATLAQMQASNLTGDATSMLSKQTLPKVTVSFDKNKPKTGELVIASAQLGGAFNPQKEKENYYTWYLKRHDKKDWDENGRYDENDWKIEAARIIAAGGFDGDSANYTKDADDDGFDVFPKLGGSNCDDCWNKTKGSNNQNGSGAPNCYVNDFQTGQLYELRDHVEDWTNSCPTGYHQTCAGSGVASCDHDANPATAAVVADFCRETATTEDLFCRVKPDAKGNNDVRSFEAQSGCAAGLIPVCVASSNFNLSASSPSQILFPASRTDSQICSVYYPDPITTILEQTPASCAQIQNPLYALTTIPGSAITYNGWPKCTFKKGDNFCKHLFPRTKTFDPGDGEFEVDEEKFWGTNPNKNMTAGTGVNDEASVVGLGITKFKWQYKNGDELGLVVEGDTAIPTKHDDASVVRTWGFSKNTCEALSDEIKSQTSKTDSETAFYKESVRGVDVGIMVTSFDLDECLAENLIDLTEAGGQNVQELYNDLTYAYTPAPPQIPMNDPSGDQEFNRGDELTVQAKWLDLVDTNKENYLYEWSLEVLVDPENQVWNDITSSYLNNFTVIGYGLDKLNIPLAIPLRLFGENQEQTNQKIRFKTKITVDNELTQNYRKGSLEVEINNLINDITPHFVNIENDGKLSLGRVICNNAEERYACGIFENELLGLELTDPDDKFLQVDWYVEGEKVVCNNAISNRCDASQKTIFFPAVKSPGSDLIEVRVEAKEATGKTFKVSKVFKVVNLVSGVSARLVSADADAIWPRVAGYRKDSAGNSIPVLSEKIFETYPQKEVSLEYVFSPSWVADKAQINTRLLGAETVDFNGKEIKFVADGLVGDSYDLSYEIAYQQTPQTVQVLENFWGLKPANVIAFSKQGTAKIDVKIDPSQITPEKFQEVWGANLISKLGDEIPFVIRLFLSMLTILGLFAIPLSFLEKAQFKR